MTTFKDSPHPNAALLLATWLVSEEGRALFETVLHEADIRPGSKSALAKEIADAKAKVIFEDVATMDQRAEYYKKFSALVRGQ
jgi:iron(III) transport system substrate-binding protein